MAQMIRPRDMLEGEYSLGEQKVIDQIKKLKPQPKKSVLNQLGLLSSFSNDSKQEIVRIDSLVESAFNSVENEKWEKYQFSVKDPVVSERSEEQYLIHSAGNSEPDLDDEHD